MDKVDQRFTLSVRAYIFSYRNLLKSFRLLRACFNGFWLGILRKDTLHLVDKYCYDTTGIYDKDVHNKGGLWEWEQKAVDKYFKKCKSILVIGAGGGREVLTLLKSGYDVDGVECNHKLFEYATELLKREGFQPAIKLVPRDQSPDADKIYDGFIIGYNTYMLIQKRVKRVALLRNLRNIAQPNSPVLLSFTSRSGNERRFKIIVLIGNVLRWILRTDPLEIGDDLFPLKINSGKRENNYLPYYLHYFTEEEITSELREGGFTLDLFSTEGYGHAVGIATKGRKI